MSILRESWFMLTGLPYPVRGFVSPEEGAEAPYFKRDETEWIIDQINRMYPTPAYESKADSSGDPGRPAFDPTHAGLEEGYTWYGPIPVGDTLYWQLGRCEWPWQEVAAPDENEFHLELEYRESDACYYGSGRTLIQALADLERSVMTACGPEAAFHECCYLINRDIVELAMLTEMGGILSAYDFSDPEGAFEIRRIPQVPQHADPPKDRLGESLKRLETAVYDLKHTLENRRR